MSRLATFLTAMWLSSAAAHPGFIPTIQQAAISPFSNATTDLKDQATNEVQAGLDHFGQTITYIGDGLCNQVKRIAGVAYEDYDKEPDMSKLTLIFKTGVKTVTYNLTEAPEQFPKERWFNPNLTLRVYMHGFIENPSWPKSSFQTMSSAFSSQEGQLNILGLDSSSLISFFYLRASTMVQFIGERVGRTLAALVPAGLDPKRIHLIGHSLGGHIAGFTGQTFFSLTGSRVGRISGLDPAGPCFSKVDPTLRLSKEDTDFVDVIHTDAGVYGIDQPIGHVDFWPNGGAEQPNCLSQTCSHNRVWEIYAQSVLTPEAFIAVKCKSTDEFRHGHCNFNDTSVMGYGTPANTRGSYYCQTLGEAPFAIGAKGLTYNETAVVGFATNTAKDALFSGQGVMLKSAPEGRAEGAARRGASPRPRAGSAAACTPLHYRARPSTHAHTCCPKLIPILYCPL